MVLVSELVSTSQQILIKFFRHIRKAIIFYKWFPAQNVDSAQDLPDYEWEKAMRPIRLDASNYTDILNDLEMDGVMYVHYLNQSFVSINEERILNYINEVISLLDTQIK